MQGFSKSRQAIEMEHGLGSAALYRRLVRMLWQPSGSSSDSVCVNNICKQMSKRHNTFGGGGLSEGLVKDNFFAENQATGPVFFGERWPTT